MEYAGDGPLDKLVMKVSINNLKTWLIGALSEKQCAGADTESRAETFDCLGTHEKISCSMER